MSGKKANSEEAGILALRKSNDRLKAELSRAKRINMTAAGVVGIAHDVRNCLYAIAGGILLEKEKRGNEKSKKYLGKAAGDIDKIACKLANVLSTDKNLLINKAAGVQVGSIVQSTAGMMASSFQKAGVALEMYVSVDIPTITASSGGIGSIILELLTNSLKVCIPGDTVRIKAVVEGREILVEISDTARNVVDKASGGLRARTSLIETVEKSGSGLGLEIISWIAREHGSKIEAEKIPGGGSVFRMRLPVVCPEDSEALSNSREFAG